MYLLKGIVFPKLLVYKDKLKSTPNSIIKSWSNLNENIRKFTVALVNNGINNKTIIIEKWKKDSNCKLSFLYI